ncbi:MAG: flagellar basal body P-ring formation chaperone FlgA [Bacteroidota bacterium]
MKFLLLILLGFFSLQAKSFDEAMKTYLHNNLSSFDKIEYSVVQMPRNFGRIEINNDKKMKLVKNFAYVPVKVFDKNDNVSLAFITVKVKLYKTALVAVQKVSANEILTEALFQSKMKDVASIESSLIEPRDLNLYRSRVSMKEGTILSKDFVELIPIINKGDKVIIHAGKNGVDISLEARAREDGHLGEIIRVQVESKIFKAKVIDKYNLMLVE